MALDWVEYLLNMGSLRALLNREQYTFSQVPFEYDAGTLGFFVWKGDQVIGIVMIPFDQYWIRLVNSGVLAKYLDEHAKSNRTPEPEITRDWNAWVKEQEVAS